MDKVKAQDAVSLSKIKAEQSTLINHFSRKYETKL